MQLIKVMLVAAMLLQPVAALAADLPRRLAHYTHQPWTEAIDAPAPVLAIAQGRDGFLWLATGQGLFRFDGVSFEPIVAEGDDQSQGQPSALLVTRNGDVWSNFSSSGRFAIYRKGALRLLDAPAAPNRVIDMAEGLDGSIWALTAKFDAEVLRLRNGQWTSFNVKQGLPLDDALSMLVAADGAVWISFCNSVVRLAAGATRFETVRSTPQANGRLSVDQAGRIWLSEKRGSYPISGPGGAGSPPPLRAPYPTDDAQIRGAPVIDHAGNLWIATRYDGVQRVASINPSGSANPLAERLQSSGGLSSDVTYDVLEDREGNLWVGTEKGLDKLRPATLRAEPELTRPAAFGDKLLAASDGSVYIGEARTIYRIAAGGRPEPILQNISEPQALCEAPDGAIWIAFSDQITVWRNGRVQRRIDRAPASNTHSIIFDCAFDSRGDYWTAAGGGGMHRFHDGRWEAMYGSAAVDGFYPTTLVAGPRGNLVVQWSRDSLAWIGESDQPSLLRFDAEHRRRFIPDHGQGGPQALTLYPTSAGDIIAAGAFGLSRFQGMSIQTLWADPTAADRRISGLVQTPEGDTWIAYPRTLVRFRSSDLAEAFSKGEAPRPTLTLGLGDGLTSRPHSHSQRSIVRGGDGRLWVATETGALWMDPRQIARTYLPPGLAIKSVTANGHLYRDPASLKLGSETPNVEIDFAVLNFADPKRSQVRYRLKGFDSTWIDPGARRQAFYTNLPPGKYEFQVIAASSEGVWNRKGASVEFEIPPTFFQSPWFPLLCLALATGLFWLLYRLRVAQVAERVRVGLEARLGERDRIARELHDTLLQSVQGLILRFQSVANKMAPGDPSRDLLETALKRADDVIVDGRNRVRDLRIAEGPRDLRATLEDVIAATGFDPAVLVQVTEVGAPRAVHPLIVAEIGRLSGEALFNIVRHARATAVEVMIEYSPHQLLVRLRDNGVGIAEEVLEAGRKPGHFGLIGMRERAQRIGGAFFINRRAGAGTEVALKLPANLAFADRAKGARRPFSQLRSWRGTAGV
ncbi:MULTISPECIES: sensor histidine kinase [Phenylobacterium]|uniref:Signal transduction histidine kinase/ligand-binding sensor domain-containing protein n=1 Tax=Phenylobacterium koreense TaxID=266125 RepID=A0ABV2EEV2_9CAUL